MNTEIIKKGYLESGLSCSIDSSMLSPCAPVCCKTTLDATSPISSGTIFCGFTFTFTVSIDNDDSDCESCRSASRPYRSYTWSVEIKQIVFVDIFDHKRFKRLTFFELELGPAIGELDFRFRSIFIPEYWWSEKICMNRFNVESNRRWPETDVTKNCYINKYANTRFPPNMAAYISYVYNSV